MSQHSALRRAIEKDNLDGVIAALEHGGDIEEVDIHGDPGLPLRTACFRGNTEIVRLLIERGANIHAPNAQGVGGPIRMAVRGGHLHIVTLLLEYGAALPEDVNLPSTSLGERRGIKERRRRNMGPPAGLRERRRNMDRRVTTVREIELDDAQWDTYFSASQLTASQLRAHMQSDDNEPFSGLDFGRIRD